MRIFNKNKARYGSVLLLPAAALVLAGCSGASGASSKSSSAPARQGGTATFAELPGTTPNYILPIVDSAHDTFANVEQLEPLLYRPLYFIGKGSSPTLDESLSIAAQPAYSHGGKTVTITLKKYAWSDGKPVTSRDLQFTINLIRAAKDEWANYVPGNFPDNVKSTKVISSHKLSLTLTHAYSKKWFTSNQLALLTPLPQQVWDKTSAAGKVGNYDQTTAGAKRVYAYLVSQAKNTHTYASNPLWKVVDGPWRIASYQQDGRVKFVPNAKYSGTPKPRLSAFVEEPFTTAAAELNVLHAGKDLDYGYVPTSDVSQANALQANGYQKVPWKTFGFNYIELNYNNPSIGPILRQAYVRQAMQRLIDEKSFVQGPMHGTGSEICGPVPPVPSNPYITSYAKSCPYSFDVAKAISTLKAHGWAVHPNGVSACDRPGKGANECGAGIARGAQLSVSMEYASGQPVLSQEVQAMKSSFAQAGITMRTKSAPTDTVIAAAVACKPSQSSCSWQLDYWGAGWAYSTNPYPTGDVLFETNGSTNTGGYSNPKMDSLIRASLAPNSGIAALQAYERYAVQQIPDLWMPEEDYQISEIQTTLHGTTPQSSTGYITPEEWYFVK